MSSIYYRGKICWYARMNSGDRTRIRLGSVSRKEAEIIQKQLDLKYELGQNVIIPSKTKIFPLIDKYLISLEAAGSTRNHIKHQNSFIKEFINKYHIINLSEIDAFLMEKHLADLRKKGLAQATRKHSFNAVRAFLNWCINNDIIDKNPFRSIKTPRIDTKIPLFLKNDEPQRLIAAAKGNLVYMIYIALATGIRAGEMQRLKWTDFDFDKGTLTIHQSKSKRFRVIPFSIKLKTLLAPIRRDLGPVFTYARIPPKKPYKAAVKAARLNKDITFHTLRHTFATDFYKKTKNVIALQQILGHRDITTTMIYTHISPDDLSSAASCYEFATDFATTENLTSLNSIS